MTTAKIEQIVDANCNLENLDDSREDINDLEISLGSMAQYSGYSYNDDIEGVADVRVQKGRNHIYARILTTCHDTFIWDGDTKSIEWVLKAIKGEDPSAMGDTGLPDFSEIKGVGPGTVEKIEQFCRDHSLYKPEDLEQHLDQLKEIKGVGQSIVDRIKDTI